VHAYFPRRLINSLRPYGGLAHFLVALEKATTSDGLEKVVPLRSSCCQLAVPHSPAQSLRAVLCALHGCPEAHQDMAKLNGYKLLSSLLTARAGLVHVPSVDLLFNLCESCGCSCAACG
jgi:hypothetical protein